MKEGDRIGDRSHCACAEALFGESSTKLSRRIIYNNLLISKETQQRYGEREDQEKEKK